MQRLLIAAVAMLACAAFAPASLAQTHDGTNAKITFGNSLEQQARAQLRGILARHKLDPWIVTRHIRFEAGAEPHSRPMLTLNTDFLDDDTMQLSIFLHEQIHWLVHRAKQRDAAITALRKLYPDPPRANYQTYQHILVAWIELDAMAELIGEQQARNNLKKKVRRLNADARPEVAKVYRWYNYRALEDTDAVGAIVAGHGMLITPNKGLAVEETDT